MFIFTTLGGSWFQLSQTHIYMLSWAKPKVSEPLIQSYFPEVSCYHLFLWDGDCCRPEMGCLHRDGSAVDVCLSQQWCPSFVLSSGAGVWRPSSWWRVLLAAAPSRGWWRKTPRLLLSAVAIASSLLAAPAGMETRRGLLTALSFGSWRRSPAPHSFLWLLPLRRD